MSKHVENKIIFICYASNFKGKVVMFACCVFEYETIWLDPL